MTPDRPEPLRVAFEVIEILDRLGIRYHLGGSYASSAHGIPRQTQNIDLVLDADEASVRVFFAELPADYYRDLDLALEAVRRKKCFNLIHLASDVKLDLFILGDEPFDLEEFARSQEIAIGSAPDHPLHIKSAEDTILRKLQWFRLGGEVSDRQWSDVAGILDSQGTALDFEYLERWVTEIGVGDLLEQIRRGS